MVIKDSKTAYKTPRAKVVEVNVKGVLCQSIFGGINSMSIDEDGGEDFN